jgi:hypothetical protein
MRRGTPGLCLGNNGDDTAVCTIDPALMLGDLKALLGKRLDLRGGNGQQGFCFARLVQRFNDCRVGRAALDCIVFARGFAIGQGAFLWGSTGFPGIDSPQALASSQVMAPVHRIRISFVDRTKETASHSPHLPTMSGASSRDGTFRRDL